MNNSLEELRYLQLGPGRIAYRLAGKPGAPCILLMHGMGDRGDSFRFLSPLLVDAGFRVVTMDSRGHGDSSAAWPDYRPRSVAEDAIALLSQLNSPAVILGNSSSAAAALWVAAESPHLVSAVILESGFFGDAALPWYLRAATALVTRSPTLWGAYYASLLPTRKPADFSEYLPALKKKLAEPGRMAALRGNATGKAECLARLPEITAPTLVLVGGKDPDFPDPEAEARRFEAALSGHAASVTVRVVKHAGHYPHAEFPDETASAVLAFLRGALA